MKVAEILDYASKRLVGKNISSDDAIDWINDALDEMGTDARKFATSQISAPDKNSWYNLPANCLKVAEVLDSDGRPYFFWHTDGVRIKFKDVDTYTLRYYTAPSKVTSVNDTPDCPAVFYRVLAYYIAYRFDDRDFPGTAISTARFNQYRLRYTEALKDLQKKERYVHVWRWS